MNQVCLNGRYFPAGDPILRADNRGYRYGDGLFETIRVHQGRFPLGDLHFERLFSGLGLLQIKLPVLVTTARLKEEILRLCRHNHCESSARVRLSVFRGHGGLYDGNPEAGYLIEAWPLEPAIPEWNENGLLIGIYPDARKSQDPFSHLKSASAQAYVMAALFSRQHHLNDCLLLNHNGDIADSTIANLFLVRNGSLVTPALTEGCVAGVMRRHLLDNCRQSGMDVQETRVSPAMLLEADEVFLSNAIKGIRWVKEAEGKTYGNRLTAEIYNRFVRTLFH